MKKLLAVLLSLCLVVGLVPMMALADDAAAAEDTTAASSNWVDTYWEHVANWEEYQNRPHWGWGDYPWWGDEPVAQIGDTWYYSLEEALADNEGGTIYLYQSVRVGDINLTGNASFNIQGVNNPTIYCDTIKVTDDEVTLRGLTVSGNVYINGGGLYMDDVDVYGSRYDVYVASGKLSVYTNCGIDSIYVASGATATVNNGLAPIEQADGSIIYTDDVSDYYVAYANGKYYGDLAEALRETSSGTVKLLTGTSIYSATVNSGVSLVIPSNATLKVTGKLTINGAVYNYGTLNGSYTGTLYNYVDIDTVPSSADVTVWQRYDGNYGWHDWDRYHWHEVNEEADGEYWLTPGWYYYEVSERGYVGDSGWFEVDNSAVGFTVRLEDDAEYRVYVDTMANGSVTVDPTYAKEGERVYITVKPNSGYTLSSLTVTRPNGSTVKLTEVRDNYFRFEMPGSRVTVDAEFERTTMPFNDVSRSDWFYDAVNYVYFNNLMDGVSSTQFAPNSSTTRAMVVEIIYRMAGSPSVSTTAGFTDVASSAWYADAVNWAARRGIVEGRTATTFDPNAPVTREELATLLYRYAVNSGYDTSVGANTNILSYTDAGSISEYAFDSLQWACGAGIVNGTGNGVLSPQGQATRAQLAAMLMRFCSEYVD